MNIRKYALKILLLAAIKSEVDSRELYKRLANRVKNALLKDRLLFLAGEEEKHQAYLETLYRERFPGEKINIPDKTPVPMPVVDASKHRLLSEIIEDAMKAELAAKDFYDSLKERFDDDKIKEMLHILAKGLKI